jgi:hypothetical protein
MSFISIAKLLVLKTQVKIPDVSHTIPARDYSSTTHVYDPYSSVSLIWVALLSLGTSPGVLCKRRGEPLLRRGTLPGQTSNKRRERPGCVLDFSKVPFDFD